MRIPLLLLSLAATATAVANETATPIVLWHGMGDNCCNPWSMGAVQTMLEEMVGNGVYVRSLMIGDNAVSDTEHGFFMDVNKQVQMVCDKIGNDTKLQNG